MHNEAKAVIKATVQSHENQIEMLERERNKYLGQIKNLDHSMKQFQRRIGELNETLDTLNEPTTGFAFTEANVTAIQGS